MTGLTKFSKLAALGAAALLASCSGSTEVASPGEGPFLPAPGSGGGGGGTTTPPPGTPAADCPTGFTNVGLAANNTLRNCQLPNLITGNLTVPLAAGVIYSISGRVDVGIDRGANHAAPVGTAGVLTLQAGVRVFGSNGLDYIVVNRGSQIFAVGTSTSPVVFTSRASVEGTTTENSIGQWGGLVILGRANISNCPGADATAAAANYGTANCQAQVEGTNAFYGGTNNQDSSGALSYVRVMHSGFEVLPNNELNGITFAGVGSGTTVDHVQVHNSSDDGVEFFGGTVNVRHLVLTGNDDDSIDTDQGYNGAIQYALVVQRPGGGDRILEASMAALATTNPRSRPILANFTLIGHGFSSSGVMTLNTGTDYRLYNGVAGSNSATKPCLDVDNAPSTTAIFRSIFMTCAVSYDADVDTVEELAFFGAGSNNNTAGGTSTLTGNRTNGANETAVTPVAYSSLSTSEIPASIKAFLVDTTYIGAVKDSTDTWYVGWTCSALIGQPAC